MSRRDKLLGRFRAKPADFGYDEMTKMLKALGYRPVKSGRTSGSRIAFCDPRTGHIIRLHRPHPGRIMKRYQLDLVEEALRSRGRLG